MKFRVILNCVDGNDKSWEEENIISFDSRTYLVAKKLRCLQCLIESNGLEIIDWTIDLLGSTVSDEKLKQFNLTEYDIKQFFNFLGAYEYQRPVTPDFDKSPEDVVSKTAEKLILIRSQTDEFKEMLSTELTEFEKIECEKKEKERINELNRRLRKYNENKRYIGIDESKWEYELGKCTHEIKIMKQNYRGRDHRGHRFPDGVFSDYKRLTSMAERLSELISEKAFLIKNSML